MSKQREELIEEIIDRINNPYLEWRWEAEFLADFIIENYRPKEECKHIWTVNTDTGSLNYGEIRCGNCKILKPFPTALTVADVCNMSNKVRECDVVDERINPELAWYRGYNACIDEISKLKVNLKKEK